MFLLHEQLLSAGGLLRAYCHGLSPQLRDGALPPPLPCSLLPFPSPVPRLPQYPSRRPPDARYSITKNPPERASPSPLPSQTFVSPAEIARAAARRGVTLDLAAIGPFFQVTARDARSDEVLGTAQGFVKPWLGTRILHLDSIRMTRLSLRSEKPVFGLALLVGAAAVRHGYDCNCSKAELLAINDNEVYHSKLVRYYTRMGFHVVYHVKGGSLQDIFHMLVWGGEGTRMDADIKELLLRWSPAMRKAIGEENQIESKTS